MTDEAYQKRVEYLSKQKMVPMIQVEKPPINKMAIDNVYVSVSDVIRQMNQTMRNLSTDYIEQNAPQMLSTLLQQFSGSKKKILIVNTDRFKIYDSDDKDFMKSDMINGLIGSYMSQAKHPITQDITVIFRSSVSDYKMDLRTTSSADIDKMKTMCQSIGMPFGSSGKHDTSTITDEDETMDEMLDDLNARTNQDDNQSIETNTNGGSGLSKSIQSIKEKFGINTQRSDNSMYRAKTFEINASLLHRITPNESTVSNYQHIANDFEIGGDNPVENQMIQKASQSLATIRRTSDETSVRFLEHQRFHQRTSNPARPCARIPVLHTRRTHAG